MSKKFTLCLLSLLFLNLPHALAAPEAPAPVKLNVTNFVVEGDNPLPPEETRRLLSPFLGQHVGIEGLQSAADALEQAIRGKGNAFHRVVLPPQETSGDIKLRVVVFKIAKMEVKGAQNFPEEVVLKSLPSLKLNEVPDNPQLGREIAVANEHPARQVAVFMRESETPDSLVAEVRVTDEKPQSFFTNLNNTGSGGATGRWRLSVGVQKSDLFDADHALTASYTTSPDKASAVSQYGLFYRMPIYAAHSWLSFYGSYSDVNSGSLASTIPGSPFELSGQGRFYGIKLSHRLPALQDWKHVVELGVDDKYFINDTRFAGVKIGVDVRSRPLTLGYQGQYIAPGLSLSAGIEYARNLRSGENNNLVAYMANNPDASPNWSLWRSNFEIGQDIGAGWTATGKLRLQQTGKSLIAGEQFGIGGSRSIRGFEEREASGDKGWSVSVEVASPLFWQGLRWHAFVDAGEVRLNRPQVGQLAKDNAASLGMGLSWQMGKRLQMMLDVSRIIDPLNGSTITNHKGWGKTNFGLSAAF